MTTLFVDCFGSIGNDGNDQYPDKFLGSADVSLSTSSNSADLPAGTRFVKLATDETATVYYRFGSGTVTATTSDQRYFADLGEAIHYVGINNKGNNKIAAVLSA